VKSKKKGPVRDEALKGSLNLMVSKGPEETNGESTAAFVNAIMSGFSLDC
jgi:hypothetical protein